MQLLKWFSLMKEIVMCNKNLRLKSALKVNRPLELLKHRNFDFALFRAGGGGGGGGHTYLKSDFWESRVTKILNFALKIKKVGMVGKVANAKSSDPATSKI